MDTGGMTVTGSTGMDDGAILLVNGMVDNGAQLWGGIYADINIGDGTDADTTDGPVIAVSGILWPQNNAAPTSIIAGGKFGVVETSANLAGCDVYGIYVECLLGDSGTDPDEFYMMRFNTTTGGAEVPDAWFSAANPESVAFTESAATGATKTGAIKIYIAGTAASNHYIWTYDSVGP